MFIAAGKEHPLISKSPVAVTAVCEVLKSNGDALVVLNLQFNIVTLLTPEPCPKNVCLAYPAKEQPSNITALSVVALDSKEQSSVLLASQ